MRLKLLLALVLVAGVARAEICPAPAICDEIQKAFDAVHEKPEEYSTFAKYLTLLERSAARKCKISGVAKPLPAYKL